MAGQLNKLELSYVDENDETVSYMFQYNPNTISISKDVEWAETDGNQKNVSEKQFVNGKAKTLSIDNLFFDTTTIGNMSVYTNYIEPLESLAIVRSFTVTGDKKVKRPPYITLSWGKSAYFFECILTKLDYKFKMFSKDGTPIRAEVSMTFEEIITDASADAVVKKQAAAQTYTTTKKETLPEIAQSQYRDPDKWKIIANANPHVTNLWNIAIGTELTLPAIS